MNLERLRKGDTIIGDSGNDPTEIPPWLNRDKFRRGQEFFQRHISAATFALHCSLTIGFGVKNLVEPLAFTRKSDTAPKALLRYLKTYIHLVLWHTQDPWDPETLAHRSLQTVRKMHNTVRDAMESVNVRKRYVTQYDMALVQSGFMGGMVMYPSHFGIKCTREELEDYIHFWRGIGYLLGIQDEYNICSGSYVEAYNFCKEIEHDLVYKGLLDPPEEFETLSTAYIDGVKLLGKFLFSSRESIFAFSQSISGYRLPWLKCSWADTLRVLAIRAHLFLTRWMPGFERFLNYLSMALFRKYLHLVTKEMSCGQASENGTGSAYFTTAVVKGI